MPNIIIPDQFVDVDFAKQPEFVLGDITKSDHFETFSPHGVCRSYSDVEDLIPESEWKGEIEKMEADGGGMERLITRIFNQGNEGSCVGNAGTQALQIVMAKQFGKAGVIQMSASSLYKQIGSSPSSGAMVDDALTASSEVGILPLDTHENRVIFGDHVMPHRGFYEKFPEGWKATAKRFRVLENLIIRSTMEMMTALLKGHPVVVGRAGHSIVYVKPMYRSGALGACYVNSWTEENWGFALAGFKGGFGFDSWNYVRSSSQWAYAVRAVTDPNIVLAA